MVFDVKRTLELNKFVYKMSTQSCYAQSNYTFGLLLRKIAAFDPKTETVYQMKQENWLLKILTFWVLPLAMFPSFHIYKNGKKIGKTHAVFATPLRKMNIGNDAYELCIHSNNYVSVLKSNVQIALIKKESLTYCEQNTYEVFCSDEIDGDVLLLLMFVACIDVHFFKNGNRIDYLKCEKTIGVDKFKERTTWRP